MDLKKILEEHELLLRQKKGGERASLCGTDFCGTDLCEANICDFHPKNTKADLKD